MDHRLMCKTQNYEISRRKQGKTKYDLRLDIYFLVITSKAQLKNNDQLNVFNTKNLFSSNGIVKRIQRQQIGGKKHLESTHLIKGLFLIYLKNPQNLTIKNPNNPIKRGAKHLKRCEQKDINDMGIRSKHVRRCSTSLA